RHVEAGVLLRGEGVHLPADRVHRASDVLGRPGLGAFEDEMLDEVGDAAPLDGLVAAPGVNPDADGDPADVRNPLRRRPDPVRKDRPAVLALRAARRGAHAGPEELRRSVPVAVPTAPPVATAFAVSTPVATTTAHLLGGARVGLPGQLLRADGGGLRILQ